MGSSRPRRIDQMSVDAVAAVEGRATHALATTPLPDTASQRGRYKKRSKKFLVKLRGAVQCFFRFEFSTVNVKSQLLGIGSTKEESVAHRRPSPGIAIVAATAVLLGPDSRKRGDCSIFVLVLVHSAHATPKIQNKCQYVLCNWGGQSVIECRTKHIPSSVVEEVQFKPFYNTTLHPVI